jgi:CRP-like cAMP-binding protein
MLTSGAGGRKELAMTTKLATERLEFLRRVPAFHTLGGRDLARIDPLVDDVTVQPGHVLAREGRASRGLFIVLSGLAESSRGGETVGMVGPGAFMGDSEMWDLHPDVFTVIARTPMHLLVVGPAAFATFLEQRGVAVQVMHDLIARMGTSKRRAA